MNHLEKKNFSEPLLKWYDENKREMLWRDKENAYYTWISEIMLQQTRIEAVKEYFVRFTSELPDIEMLAQVEEERLLKLWEGLGYYNRARNLQKAAKILVEEYQGELPADYEKLHALPGIGPYTAGAIASIAYGIPVPAVDGNVLRVVMRFLACDKDISKMSVRKEVENRLREIMPNRPGDFNQGIMELGEVVCIPNGKPICEKCPLREGCLAYARGEVENFPKKAEKKARRVEKRTILVYEYEDHYSIGKRPENGLLAGLYEFPSVEGNLTKKKVEQYLCECGIEVNNIESMGQAKHIFSHVEWHMKGFRVFLASEEQLPEGLQLVTKEDLLERYTLPIAFSSFLKKI